MGAKLSSELVLIVADAAAAGVPGRLLKIRCDLARDTLFDRVKSGEITIGDAAEQDEAISIVFKYMTVAQAGIAIENLRIIADIAAKRLTTSPIQSGDFGHWAELVANLLPEERYFLAVLGDCTRRALEAHPEVGFGAEDAAAEEFTKVILEGAGTPFADYESCQAIGLGLMRTGCVKPIVLASNGFQFMGTSKLIRLLDLADVQSAMDTRDD